MDRLFVLLASRAASATGQPAAFILALLVIAVWAISGPLFRWSDTWQLVVNTGTTIATFLMVFLIQNSQNRDAAAMQAKLDEVIRATQDARNEFVGIEHLTDREIEAIRSALEHAVGADSADQRRHESINRLLKRR
jgi:low affinity Fe/Cu permease